jgi:cytosine/adenosine deaminase-related metal-dependent hydrolase
VIADYRGVLSSPGAILLEGDMIIETGSPQSIGHIEGVELTKVNGLVTPSFVNAHSHLDLSGVGNVPFDNTFVEWLVNVIKPIRSDTTRIEEDVNKGIMLSLAGGCRVLGDIAGTIQAAEIVDDSELIAVSFVELIGDGERTDEAIEKLFEIPEKFNVTPHAPYSCGKRVYEACFESGKKISTHLSETLEEIEFALSRSGEFEKVIRKLGAWDDKIKPLGKHPIDAILEIAGDSNFVSAHLNYIDDRHLEMIASSNMSVVYCPRASEYFGHKNHRYLEMLAYGINVAVGTDSLICIDTTDHLSVLDEIRLMYSRDEVEPSLLFKMATVNGATALGLESTLVTLNKGKNAGLLKFEGLDNNTLSDLMESNLAPSWV